VDVKADQKKSWEEELLKLKERNDKLEKERKLRIEQTEEATRLKLAASKKGKMLQLENK
jgi:hypothetical protein